MDVPIDKLMGKTNSVFKLVILAARRAGELNEGAAKLIDGSDHAKPGTIALKEILEGKVSYKIKEEK
jgi:DNA-directed RNA polymerase omega subunit